MNKFSYMPDEELNKPIKLVSPSDYPGWQLELRRAQHHAQALEETERLEEVVRRAALDREMGKHLRDVLMWLEIPVLPDWVATGNSYRPNDSGVIFSLNTEANSPGYHELASGRINFVLKLETADDVAHDYMNWQQFDYTDPAMRADAQVYLATKIDQLFESRERRIKQQQFKEQTTDAAKPKHYDTPETMLAAAFWQMLIKHLPDALEEIGN